MMQPTGAGAPRSSAWNVTVRRGSAPSLVAGGSDDSAPAARELQVCETTTTAFVLGSTQPAGDVDEDRAASAHVEVCRRRAGGGGVLVAPGAQLWLDVFVPTGDRLWTPDVGHAFRWLGVAAAEALSTATGVAAVVHEGRPVPARWSSVLCFAGLGSGEVSLDGHKVLGISQRRDRRGAWFRAMLLLRHVPEESTAVLAGSESELADATETLRAAAAAVEGDATLLERALVDAISAAG